MEQKFIIGIDLGGTNTKIGIVTKSFRIKEKLIFSTGNFKTKDGLIDAVCARVLGLLKKHKIAKKDVLGIGMGLPGPIDSLRGRVHYFPNISGWKDVPLSGIIQKKTGIFTLIDNDVNLITLAEFMLGGGQGSVNMVCLTLGTGVGGGIIIAGKLYRGSSLSAGELGHIPVSISGPKCGCGSRGCLESYIGNKHILKMAQNRLKVKQLDISSSGITKAYPSGLEELSRHAKRGVKSAIHVWQDVGEYLGFALSGVVNFLNPDCIVIGGGVAAAGSVLLNSVRKTVNARAMKPSKNIVRIVKARLGDDAGILGAALLVSQGKRGKIAKC